MGMDQVIAGWRHGCSVLASLEPHEERDALELQAYLWSLMAGKLARVQCTDIGELALFVATSAMLVEQARAKHQECDFDVDNLLGLTAKEMRRFSYAAVAPCAGSC